VAEDSTHDHIDISVYMVIPALLLARWWALGGWGKRLWVEEWAEGERGWAWGSKDGDWRVRGRMDEKMGNEYTEISDGSKGGGMIEPTMSDCITFTACLLAVVVSRVRFTSHIYQASSPGLHTVKSEGHEFQ
jgi:hypothetical protein